MFRHRRHRKKHYKPTTQLSIVRLIMAIGLAGIDAIWALYMSSFGLTDSTIGFISAGLVILALAISIYSTPILEKISEYKILILSTIAYILSYISIAFFQNIYVFLTFSAILTIAAVFRIESFDILFRDEAKNKTLNQEEGFLYALVNVGWLTGPLIAGFVTAKFGLTYVFYSTSVFITLALIILIMLNIKIPVKKREIIDKNIFANLGDYIKNKKLRIPYLVGAGIEIWWALIYIYVPLFIIENGLEEEIVGIFLAAVTIPLVLFEYKIGQLSDKFGFKPFLFWGFLFLGISGLTAFFISDINIILIILILASIAMAALEPLQDSFFFRQVKSLDEEKYYPIYATSGDLGSFMGKFSVAIIIFILPKNFAYLTVAAFMFIIAFRVLSLKEKTKPRLLEKNII